jgi:hypothetical protein
MYSRLYSQLMCTYTGFKVFKAIDIALQNFLHFTIFGLKSDHHVRISIRSTRYLGLTSVVFTTRTGG